MVKGLFHSIEIPKKRGLYFRKHPIFVCCSCSILSIFLVSFLIISLLSIDISFGTYGIAGSYSLDTGYGINSADSSCLGLNISLDNRCNVTLRNLSGGETTEQHFWHFATNPSYSNSNDDQYFGNFVSIYILKIEISTDNGYASIMDFFIDRETMNLYTRPFDGFSEGYSQYRFLKNE